MKKLKSKLTYANVAASLALFLALTGGTVWAAGKITSTQIGKGAVKSKNLSKSAVKARNLARNSVTATKLAKNAVSGAKLRNGAVSFAKLAAGTNVIATTTAGPIVVNEEKKLDLPLKTPMVLTPVANQPITLSVEVRGKLVLGKPEESCQVTVLPLVNGNPMLVGQLLQVSSPGSNSVFPNGIPVGDISFPLGLAEPGKSQTISLTTFGDPDCTPTSTVEAALVATQAK